MQLFTQLMQLQNESLKKNIQACRVSNELFFGEFETFLEHLVSCTDQIMVIGDFHFHVHDHNNISAVKLLQLLQTFDYVQHVKHAKHKGNHTRDFDNFKIR